jgi:hypothetical protein
VEELYWQEVVPPQNKTKKTKAKDTSDANNDTSNSNDTSPANSTEETAKQQPEKVQKKRREKFYVT